MIPSPILMKENIMASGPCPSEFVWGYLIAVANILHCHDQPTIAADVLGELMVERSVLDSMDLSDFDLEPLNELFDELERRNATQPNGETDER